MEYTNNRSDLIFDQKLLTKKGNANITVTKYKENDKIYSTIHFSHINNGLSKIVTKELKYFLKKTKLSSSFHTFVVGLGTKDHTADSIGPKTLDYIKANLFYEEIGLNIKNKISALEPGVMGETGIKTNEIVESVVKKIKPNLVILIDSYISKNIDCVNHTIEISNDGIIPGSGVKGINEEINSNRLGIPVIVIGVPTAIELKIKSNKKDRFFNYLLSTSNIDTYVQEVSKVIGTSINEVLTSL